MSQIQIAADPNEGQLLLISRYRLTDEARKRIIEEFERAFKEDQGARVVVLENSEFEIIQYVDGRWVPVIPREVPKP